MMGLDMKSLLIGLVIGWLVIPRVQGMIMSKVSG